MELDANLQLTQCANGWTGIGLANDEPIVAVNLDSDGQRIQLGLTFLAGRRVIDVSPEPQVWVQRIQRSAERHNQQPERWIDAIRRAMDAHGRTLGWWSDLGAASAADVGTAAAWPLLRPAVEAGHDVGPVPHWATALVRGPALAPAVKGWLESRTDRRVMRSVATRLLGPLHWWPLGLAHALTRLDPGRTADLIDAADGDLRLTNEQIVILRAVLDQAPPDRVTRMVRSSIADPARGAERLIVAVEGWHRLGDARRPLPTSLEAMEQIVAATLPVPQPVAAHPAPRQSIRPNRRTTRIRNRLEPRRGVLADLLGRPLADTFDHPPVWKDLHGVRRGDVHLVLPSGPAELTRWGEELQNCLASYARAIASGDQLVLGIRLRGQLCGAVEIAKDQSIRQIEGSNNQPLPADMHRLVVELLESVGAVRQT